MAAFRQCLALLCFSAQMLAVASCDDQSTPMGPRGPLDAGEADVQLVQNPRSCAVARISAGTQHTCAVLVDGRIFCWGANDSGQLGLGDGLARTTPAFVATAAPAVEVLAGEGGTCVRLTTGEVACWGKVPGAPTGTPAITTPKNVPLPGNATGVVVGGDHACALLASGRVLCWGRGGLVGDGSAIDRFEPVAVQGLPPTIAALFASPQHTCARTLAGKVFCWGRNPTGALGLPPPEGYLSPALTEAFGSPVATLALGPTQTCAVLAGEPFGRLACVPPLDQPIRAELGDDLRAVAVGQNHLCAIRADGLLRCAGNNEQGQVGPDPRPLIPDASAVEVFSNAISVRTGLTHTCALRADRSVWCWGSNNQGQLGIGSLTNTNVPSQVAFPPGCPL